MSKAIDYSNEDQKLFSRGKSSKKDKKKSKNKKSNKDNDEIPENSEDKNNNNQNELNNEKKELNENENINIDENFLNERNNEKEGGGLMLTELLDINNNNKKEDNKKVIFLKKKYEELKAPLKLKKGIDLGIEKSNNDIHQKITNEKLKINNSKFSVSQIALLNRSIENSKTINKNNSMTFLTGNDRILSKQNLKRIHSLNKNEEYLKRNIYKLEQNQKLIESLSFPKENIVDNNIQIFRLKKIKNNKESLLKKLGRINEQIDNLIEDEKKLEKKDKIKLDFSILENYQEDYNKRLLKINEKEKKMRLKYNKIIKLSYDKRKKDIDNKEKEMLEEKMEKLKKAKDKEKELFLKRKKIVDNILEKSKKYINEKSNKTENDYRYFKYKEKFENEEKKLFDRVKLIKKDHLVTKEELEDLVNRINEQKKLLEINNEEKKRKLIELWSCRSQTLPTYHHPVVDILEEEKNKIKEEKDLELKKKECNDLQKKNYKPPKVLISDKLKDQIDKRISMTNRDKVKETEVNIKKLFQLKFSPLKPINKKKLEHQLSDNEIINNNNYIDIKELNSFMQKKYKKILKPIHILHPKPDKPIDYLSERIKKKSENEKDNSKLSMSFDINNIINNKDLNIVESMKMAKSQIEAMDNKIKQKQELININGGYLNNPNLVDNIGKMLIGSVKAKLNILSKINGK